MEQLERILGMKLVVEGTKKSVVGGRKKSEVEEVGGRKTFLSLEVVGGFVEDRCNLVVVVVFVEEAIFHRKKVVEVE